MENGRIRKRYLGEGVRNPHGCTRYPVRQFTNRRIGKNVEVGASDWKSARYDKTPAGPSVGVLR